MVLKVNDCCVSTQSFNQSDFWFPFIGAEKAVHLRDGKVNYYSSDKDFKNLTDGRIVSRSVVNDLSFSSVCEACSGF